MKIERPKSEQPLPPDAKKVFDGIIFDVYQWEQKQFDGTLKTFEKLARVDSVMIIPVTLDNKIVLLEQEQPGKPPFIGLAGGRAEDGEDVITAAERELLEETGFKAKNFKVFDAQQPLSKVEWAVYTLVAQGCEKISEQNLDSGEKIKLKYVDFDQFVDILINEAFADIEAVIKVMRAKINGNLDEIKSLIFD